MTGRRMPVPDGLLDTVLGALPLGVILFSPGVGVMRVNPCALELLGWDPTDREAWARSDVAAVVADLGLSALRTDGGWTGAVQLPGPHGPRDVELRVFDLDDVHVLLTLQPVPAESVARDSARILAAVIEQTQDFVAWHGPVGAEARINPAAAAMVGGGVRSDQPLPHRIRDLFDEQSKDLTDRIGAPEMNELGQWRGRIRVPNRETGRIHELDWLQFMVHVNGRVIGSAGIGRDVTEETQDAERALRLQLLAAQEEERRRIAADVHDDSAQALTAVSLRLQRLRRRLEGENRVLLDEAARAAADALARLRRLIFDLHPSALDDEGLVVALAHVSNAVFGESTTSITVSGVDALELRPAIRAAVYRAAREAMINVVRHAKAARAEVVVAQDEDGVRVRVADDGAGFVVEDVVSRPGHLGLSNARALMTAAGGHVEIRSTPGIGTTIELWVPIAT